MSERYHPQQIKKEIRQQLPAVGEKTDKAVHASHLAFLMEDTITQAGEILSPLPFEKQLCGSIFDSGFGQVSSYYYLTWLVADIFAKRAREQSEQIGNLVAIVNLDNEKGITEFLDTVDKDLDKIDALNPLNEVKEGAADILELMRMKTPLSDADRQRIDNFFVDAGEFDDIVFLEFLLCASHPDGETWKTVKNTLREKNFYAAVHGQIQQLETVIREYAEGYLDQCTDAFFHPDTEDVQNDIIPAYSSLLAPFLAGHFLSARKVFPTAALEILENDFIPGLSDKMKRDLVEFYRDAFFQEYPNLLESLDEEDRTPYLWIMQSYEYGSEKEGSGQALFDEIVETFHDQESPTVERQKVFERAQKYIKRAPDFISNTEVRFSIGDETVSIDLAARGQMVDILFVSSGERAYMIHLDSEGRLWGLPDGYDEKNTAGIDWLLQQLDAFLQEEIPERRGPKKTIAPLPKRQDTSYTIPERIGQSGPKHTKRRHQRLDSEAVIPEQVTSSEKKRQKAYDVSYAERFRQQLGEFPLAAQEAIHTAIARVEYGEKKMYRLESSKAQGIKAYAIKISLDGNPYRIILREGEGAGEKRRMEVVAIENRSKVYRTREMERLMQRLQRT